MTRHITDDLLINEQFGLNCFWASRRVARHLSECDECRARALALQAKLSALDDIREKPEVPERVVANVLRAVRQVKPARGVDPSRVIWAFAKAAAVALILFAIVPFAFMRKTAEPEPGFEVAINQTYEEEKAVAQEIAVRKQELEVADTRMRQAAPAMSVGEDVQPVMIPPAPGGEPADHDMMLGASFAAARDEEAAEPPEGRTEVMVLAKADMSVARGFASGGGKDQAYSYYAPEKKAKVAARRRSDKAVLAEAVAPAAPQPAAVARKNAAPAERGATIDLASEDWTWMEDGRPVHVSIRREPSVDAPGRFGWTVSARSESDKPVSVIVTRSLPESGWAVQVVSPGAFVEELSAGHFRFTADVLPHGTTEFTYVIEPASPASGGAAENAKPMEVDQ